MMETHLQLTRFKRHLQTLGWIRPAQSRETVYGPDFICIGMLKAGTAWLYDQLRHHSDFWMPPVKELRYLNAPIPAMENAREHYSRFRNRAKRSIFGRQTGDFAFLLAASELSGLPRDFAKYADLFRFKGSRISGDITPGYSRLEPLMIAEIQRHFPEVKIVFIVREPVSRAWSYLSMLAREQKFNPRLLNDPDRFRSYFATSRTLDGSFPTRILARWKEFAPNIRFRTFFFDDIEGRPAQVRRDILLFLGADPDRKSGKLAPGFNRKANAEKLPLTEPIKEVLLEFLADEVRACADVLGGPAHRWPGWYGL